MEVYHDYFIYCMKSKMCWPGMIANMEMDIFMCNYRPQSEKVLLQIKGRHDSKAECESFNPQISGIIAKNQFFLIFVPNASFLPQNMF